MENNKFDRLIIMAQINILSFAHKFTNIDKENYSEQYIQLSAELKEAVREWMVLSSEIYCPE